MTIQARYSGVCREFFARILAALGLRPRHTHTWRTVGYGGAGWYLLRCDECGAKEIAA